MSKRDNDIALGLFLPFALSMVLSTLVTLAVHSWYPILFVVGYWVIGIASYPFITSINRTNFPDHDEGDLAFLTIVFWPFTYSFALLLFGFSAVVRGLLRERE
jgi:xanthine/uracil/vitamin C permease (AzgA family)